MELGSQYAQVRLHQIVCFFRASFASGVTEHLFEEFLVGRHILDVDTQSTLSHLVFGVELVAGVGSIGLNSAMES